MECLLCTRHFWRKPHADLGILIWMGGGGAAVRAGLWDETDWAASYTDLWDQSFVDRGREDHWGGGKGALQPTRDKQQRNLTWDYGDTLGFEHVSQRSFWFLSVTACACVCGGHQKQGEKAGGWGCLWLRRLRTGLEWETSGQGALKCQAQLWRQTRGSWWWVSTWY